MKTDLNKCQVGNPGTKFQERSRFDKANLK